MSFNTLALRARAEAHSRTAFESRFRAFVERVLAGSHVRGEPEKGLVEERPPD
jgi:hypothetical protein